MFGVKNVVGLVPVAAQSGLDFEGRDTNARIVDENIETCFQASDISSGLHRAERGIGIGDDFGERLFGGA